MRESVPVMKLRQREISAAPLLVTLDNIYLDMTIQIIESFTLVIPLSYRIVL